MIVEDADRLVVLDGNTRATAYVKVATTSFSAFGRQFFNNAPMGVPLEPMVGFGPLVGDAQSPLEATRGTAHDSELCYAVGDATTPETIKRLTFEEQAVIRSIERTEGRKLTAQQKRRVLTQGGALSEQRAREALTMRLTAEQRATIHWMRLTPDEQGIVDFVERCSGRPLTPQEINLSLEQARAIGELR
jgi:hypothetical protein